MSSEEDTSSGSDEEQPPSPVNIQPTNNFKNDGSFLEMFKKMQEETNTESESNSATSSSSKNNLVMRTAVTKRRGRVLPTGIVKKPKKEGPPTKSADAKSGKKDPWMQYMDEVKRYKQQSCSEEEGTKRPLVK